MTPDMVLQIAISVFGALCAGVGSYVGVRVELARMRERANMALDRADRAHARIDGMMAAQ